MAKLEEKLFGTMERIAQLEEENARLREEVARLQQQLAAARKNSSTSSKPPKPPGKGGKKRKRGGQPGHEQHLRPIFPPEAVNHFEPYTLDCCPDCGGSLRLSECPPDVLQQVEITTTPTVVTEHQGLAYWCPHCQKFHYAPLPETVVKVGLFGPRLTALVAFMKDACHASFATIRKFLRDVVRLDISRGYLAKLIAKVSQSLAKAYAELFERLPGEAVLNIDETGHKEYREKFWTWCFRAQLYTLFRIDKLRGSKVLIEVLGKEFNGVLGCDYFGAYRKYMREFDVLVQFCLAHLIRDVKFLITLPRREEQSYGKRVRESLRELFAVIHRRKKMSAAGFQKALETAREQVMKVATTRVPSTNHARNLAKRFREHGDAYFRFITTPGIEPTNNLAEQTIRFVVIDRRITQGTRSETGRRWCERIWTVIATCAQQGRSVFTSILDSVHAHFGGTPPPSLLPLSP
ncbi:MAG: IS66 family transposase [Thermoguttaceae bacterium]